MITRNQIQYSRSLHLKKFRDKYDEFIVEGPKLVKELLISDYRVKQVFTLQDHFDELGHSNLKGIKPEVVSQKELNRISALKNPNGMLAIAQTQRLQLSDFKMNNEFVLLLDGISDPGNLGTIIRTADWFGIHTLVCSHDTVDVYNPKVVQATMGSVFRTGIYYCNLVEFLSGLPREIPVYGTFLNGDNLYRKTFGQAGVVAIGSESHGIRPETAKMIKKKLHIPSSGGVAESLNASVAAAIICSEISRNQLKII